MKILKLKKRNTSNYPKKTSFFCAFTIVLLTSIFYLHSCSTDEETNEFIENTALQFNLDRFNLVKANSFNYRSDDLVFDTSIKRFIGNSLEFNQSTDNDIKIVSISTSEVDSKNLNLLFENFENSIEILSVTALRNDNNLPTGIIMHYVMNDGKIKLNAFKKDINSDNYNLVDFPVSDVYTYTLENILFVTSKLFPSQNIETLLVSNIDTHSSISNYDDLMLLNFGAKHEMSFIFNSLNTNNIIGSGDSFIDGEAKPCSMAVHTCRNGSDEYSWCASYCKRPPCSKETTSKELSDKKMIAESRIFERNLPFDKLYKLRDFLELTNKGKSLIDAYYASSSHFGAALNFDVLMSVVSSSQEIGIFINALLEDNQNYTLTEETYNLIADIVLKSAKNSNSQLYKGFVNEMIEDNRLFINKNIGQIQNILNQ